MQFTFYHGSGYSILTAHPKHPLHISRVEAVVEAAYSSIGPANTAQENENTWAGSYANIYGTTKALLAAHRLLVSSYLTM